MNRTYKIIYSDSAKTFVAVAENVTAKGKRSSSRVSAVMAESGAVETRGNRLKMLKAALLYAGFLSFSNLAFAGPAVCVNPQDPTQTVGTASGVNALACGQNAEASGLRSTALGFGAKAEGKDAIAIGKNAEADKTSAIAMGLGAKAQGVNSLSIGTNAKTSSGQAVAIGMDSGAAGTQATAVGAGAKASRNYSTAVGRSAQALGISSLALGDEATTTQGYSVAIGHQASVTGTQSGSMALGNRATVGAFSDAVAMGTDAQANGQNAYALGHKAKATGKSALAIGDESKAGIDAIALGTKASASGQYGIAIGEGAKVFNSANGSLAIGKGAVATREDSTVIGSSAGSNGTTGERHTLIGYTAGSEMSGEENTAVGSNSLTGAKKGDFIGRTENAALGINAGSHMVGGHNAAVGGYAGQDSEGSKNTYMGHEAGRKAKGSHNVAVGKSANKGVTVDNATALGGGTKVTADGGVALGQGSVAVIGPGIEGYVPDGVGSDRVLATKSTSGSVSVGDAEKGLRRQITNVAAGKEDTDAVNVSQLKSLVDIASAGWIVSAQGRPGENVAPGAKVDFSNTDDNIVISNDETDLKFALADTLRIGSDDDNKVIIGDDGGGTDEDGNAIPGITVPGGKDGDQKVVIGGGDVAIHMPELEGGGPLYVGKTLMAGLNFSGNNFVDGDPDTFVNRKFGQRLEILGQGWIETEVSGDALYIKLRDDFPVIPTPGGGVPGGGGGQPAGGELAGGNLVAGGDIQGGKNINVKPGDEDYSLIVETTPDVEHDSVTVGDVVINQDGINAGNKTITNVARGVDGTDAVNVDQLDGGLDDLDKELTTKGLNFADSQGDVIHRDLGQTLDIVGANENITTKASPSNGILEIVLSDDLNVESVTINNGGPIINSEGINMNDNRITNVAAGVDGNDAVNVDQLETVRGNLQGQVNNLRHDMRRMDKKLSAGVAAAMATAALPQAYLPGKNMMAMSGGTWNGESGMAIGYSGISDNGSWVYKLSGNASSRGDYGGAVGIGYQW